MRVIVSKELKDNFSNYKVVSDWKYVDENLSEIDLLIFHSCNESDFNTGVKLANISNQSNVHLMYINENPQTAIKMVIQGAEGEIITDEFYFEDEEELNELVKNLKVDKEEDTSLISINVIKDFMKAFTRGEERIKTPAYLSMVNEAIDELMLTTRKQEAAITQMGSSAIDIFKKAYILIRNLEDKRLQIEEQLKVLESNQDNGSLSNSSTFNSNISSYPPVRFMGTVPLLLIREYSPCRYLTSFALGYTHHVHFTKNKSVKLVVIHQKGTCVAKKYDEFTAINEESAGYATLYNSEYIATNTPKKDILREIFKQPVDAFIVVDRLYGGQDIITGKISKLNAVSGKSDIKRYSIKPEDTLLSNVSLNETEKKEYFGTLKRMTNYPDEKDGRLAYYEQACEEMYEKLDKLLGL